MIDHDNRSKATRDPNRDERGRFRKGHAIPGPGRLTAGKMAKVREALSEVVEPDEIAKTWQVLVGMAHGGDLDAIKEVLSRTIGKGQIPAAMGLAADLARFSEVPGAFGQIFDGLADGAITADEARELAAVAAGASKAHEAATLEALRQRLEGIEGDSGAF